MLEDFGQDLWGEPVDGNLRVPFCQIHVQGLGEILLCGNGLWIVGGK
jgi:hypothetical protein